MGREADDQTTTIYDGERSANRQNLFIAFIIIIILLISSLSIWKEIRNREERGGKTH